MASKREKTQSIPIKLDSIENEDVPIIAFIFTNSGKLIKKQLVKGESIELPTSIRDPRLIKVLIAPASSDKIESVSSISELNRYKPFAAVLGVNNKGGIESLVIPKDFWRLWFLKSCRVRGEVVKNYSISDTSQERGICHARVHICEVDRIRLWIKKIPDNIIARIPEIFEKPELPFPIPDPQSVDPFISENNFKDIGSEKISKSVSDLIIKGNFNTLLGVNPLGLESKLTKAQLARVEIVSSPSILDKLDTNNLNDIREVLANNFSLFHSYFCIIPWLWPYFYRCQEMTTVYTDMNGAFDTTIWYLDDGDQPDLYFWVECLIDGVWTTVYKPSKPCNTYWNYICGSEVIIHISDPRVRWECNDIVEGDIVWVKTIGLYASVNRIEQNSQVSTIQGVPFNHIGLTNTFTKNSTSLLTHYRSPFGGTLNLVVQFGSSLPTNGMYYYRWSYRKLKNSDLSPSTESMTLKSLHNGQALHKSYTYEYFDSSMHKHIGTNTFKLGPHEVNSTDDLYIIPPVMPASSPVNASEASPLWNQNTSTAHVDSLQFDDGLYEFVLELFDESGNKLSSIPKHIFQIPHKSSFSPSINAPNDYLLVNGAQADGYKMNVRIDNAQTEASIYQLKVNGVEQNTNCCGFVSYKPTDNIEVAFRAYHPNNFATFKFDVKKGTCNDPAQEGLTDAEGMVVGDANGYTRDSTSIYRKSLTPSQLLSLCASGGKAAFAEDLYVKALATNGSKELHALDSSELAAFALEPE